MAKKNAKVARDDDVEGQEELFPELDDSNEAHRVLMAAAKKLKKERENRTALLTTSKAKVDAAAERVLVLMHQNKLVKFRHKGVITEVISTTEKVEVRMDDEEEDAEED